MRGLVKESKYPEDTMALTVLEMMGTNSEA
jgi:hypothetical protein